MTETVKYSWKDIEFMISDICWQLHHPDIDLVLGVSRGGLVPAVMISHHLDVDLMAVKWSTRDHVGQVVGDLSSFKNVLVVDDICDSGKTFIELHQHLTTAFPNTNFKFAALVHNLDQPFDLDYWSRDLRRVEDPLWRVFPWERGY